jgi:hypothetical protein
MLLALALCANRLLCKPEDGRKRIFFCNRRERRSIERQSAFHGSVINAAIAGGMGPGLKPSPPAASPSTNLARGLCCFPRCCDSPSRHILYVITGNFTASDRRPSKPSLPAEDGQAIQHCYALSTLSDSDRVLLRDFHAAPPQVQVGVQMTLGAFAPSAIEARKCESTA